MEYPKTVEEAIQRLLEEMPKDGKDLIAGMSTEEELYGIHHSLGRAIRNEMGLWQGNDCLLAMCMLTAVENGQKLTRILPTGSKLIMHPDDASHTILVELWKKLRKGGMKLQKAIELLKDIGPYRGTLSEDDLKAIRLGIEAMEGIMALRRGRCKALSQLLPGETKE